MLDIGAWAAGVPADVVQAKSVWSSEFGGATHVLTIIDRQGDTFRARFEIAIKGKAIIIRDVTGPVKGNQISWLAKNVHATKGKPGGDNFGTIDGDRIEFRWRDDKGGYGPPFTLVRVADQNGQSVPTSPLASVANTAPAAIQTAAVRTDPNQPLLETLSQQAPNASAWVLAPLDAGVPPDIRQNVTYLREDLLDEAAKKPKASLEAYKTGEQLCNTMIAALDERDRTLVRTGFRAVEAQARTGVTSDALEARRNYKMSWPQFARENAQRAELKGQANANAAVMAARPKLEWSNRTDQIRPTLDMLYKQFREALRQSPAAK